MKKGKCQAGTLVNELSVAKIRSNLHTGQYAGDVPSDHGQRQALVEPLSPKMSTSFFARQLKKGAVDLPYTPVVSIATG